MAENVKVNPKPKFSFESMKTKLGIVGGIIAILGFIPQVREFLGWTKSLNYVEVRGAFPNEKWMEAEEKDFAWLVGEWNVLKLRGFSSIFKIENGLLYRQNKSAGNFNQTDNFVSQWYPVETHINTDGLLHLAYPKESKWPLNFIRKTDDCVCYECERYPADDGTIRSGEQRQMLNAQHTRLSDDGITYTCY